MTPISGNSKPKTRRTRLRYWSPQLVESRWYYTLLHNRRAAILKTVLLPKGRNRIVIVNVPWNLEKELPSKVADRKELRDWFRA
jgi:hypothetical protein